MPEFDVAYFNKVYATVGAGAVLELERRVLGSDYGANGYTDVAQAGRLVELLGLDAESRLLDLGCGAGWPGLYVAAQASCRAVLADVPMAGLRAAAARARRDGVAATPVAAEGELLPFRDRSFDAVTHADVLC